MTQLSLSEFINLEFSLSLDVCRMWGQGLRYPLDSPNSGCCFDCQWEFHDELMRPATAILSSTLRSYFTDLGFAFHQAGERQVQLIAPDLRHQDMVVTYDVMWQRLRIVVYQR